MKIKLCSVTIISLLLMPSLGFAQDLGLAQREGEQIRDLIETFQTLPGDKQTERWKEFFSSPYIYIVGGVVYKLDGESMRKYLDNERVSAHMKTTMMEPETYRQSVVVKNLTITLIDSRTAVARWNAGLYSPDSGMLLDDWPNFVTLVKQADGWRIATITNTEPRLNWVDEMYEKVFRPYMLK